MELAKPLLKKILAVVVVIVCVRKCANVICVYVYV